MSGKIKIALCLSGEPRSSMFCFPYIYESFINIGPEYEVDVYMHSRKNVRALRCYHPQDFAIDSSPTLPFIEYINSLKLPPLLEQEKNYYKNITSVNDNILHQFLMVDGIHKSFTLSKKNDKIYDIYIRCRFDIFTDFFIDIQPIIRDILDKKYDMFIPTKDFYNINDINNSKNEYNDQFAIGNYKSTESYSNIINNLEYLLNATFSFKAERWLKSQLDQSSIKVFESIFPIHLARSLYIKSNRGIPGSLDVMFFDQ